MTTHCWRTAAAAGCPSGGSWTFVGTVTSAWGSGAAPAGGFGSGAVTAGSGPGSGSASGSAGGHSWSLRASGAWGRGWLSWSGASGSGSPSCLQHSALKSETRGSNRGTVVVSGGSSRCGRGCSGAGSSPSYERILRYTENTYVGIFSATWHSSRSSLTGWATV